MANDKIQITRENGELVEAQAPIIVIDFGLSEVVQRVLSVDDEPV